MASEKSLFVAFRGINSGISTTWGTEFGPHLKNNDENPPLSNK
jgi:hypothetical protein